MTNKRFIELVRFLVFDYTNKHYGQVDKDDVFIVWMCKTLQNYKALAATTNADGMYYEVTYNGDKDEIYLDAYKKSKNVKIENVDGIVPYWEKLT